MTYFKNFIHIYMKSLMIVLIICDINENFHNFNVFSIVRNFILSIQVKKKCCIIFIIKYTHLNTDLKLHNYFYSCTIAVIKHTKENASKPTSYTKLLFLSLTASQIYFIDIIIFHISSLILNVLYTKNLKYTYLKKKKIYRCCLSQKIKTNRYYFQ